jgi:hypothetical protein
MKSISRNSIYVLFLGVLFMVGCVPYKGMLKQSYSIYNQAVTKDAQYRMTQVKNKMTDFSNSPAKADYQMALDTIKSFVGQYKDKLVTDNVYGNVLALKAMCEYGLESYDAAVATASESLPYLKSSVSNEKSRDNALMTAMPGLVKANQLYEKMPKDKKKVEMSVYNDIAALAQSALDDLEAGRKETAEKQTNEYLLTSKLAVYKNWLDTAFYTADAKSSDAEKAQKRQREDEILAKAKGDISTLEGVVGNNSATVALWKALIGVD